jgi:hypothetical protein
VRLTVRRVMVVVGIASAASLLIGFVWVVDAVAHGPYATALNRRCQRLAVQGRLVGRPETEVAKILGPPCQVWRSWSTVDSVTRQPSPGAYRVTTFNYAPCPFVACGLFQVHCRNGVVESTELLWSAPRFLVHSLC